jgi:hypothetical protein
MQFVNTTALQNNSTIYNHTVKIVGHYRAKGSTISFTTVRKYIFVYMRINATAHDKINISIANKTIIMNNGRITAQTSDPISPHLRQQTQQSDRHTHRFQSYIQMDINRHIYICIYRFNKTLLLPADPTHHHHTTRHHKM